MYFLWPMLFAMLEMTKTFMLSTSQLSINFLPQVNLKRIYVRFHDLDL